MSFREILTMSLDSVKGNALRSVLTLLIIAVGITALVGILTALDSVLYAMNESFNDMGSNSFSIDRKFQDVQATRGGRRKKMGEPIDYEQAYEFKDRFEYPGAKVALSIRSTRNAVVQRGEKKTNPTVTVMGIDDNYLDVGGRDLTIGRNFSDVELQSGSNIAIIGSDVVKLLFDKNNQRAVNQDILVGNTRYRIAGVLKSRGTSGGDQSADLSVFIPLSNSRRIYDSKGADYDITVAVNTAMEMEAATDAATGLFRQVRKLRITQDDDFEIFKSDSLLAILKENTVKIRWATIAIGLITLLGASIGLMNIMLVSVTERTREIGIRKALGATRSSILTQFLSEAIMICQMGGLVGIVLGVLVGLAVSFALESSFIVPWAWITLGIVTCFVVGLFAGLYPAMRASRLDPIESLRYE
jgi:putative ABC transport system permease protein